MNLDSTILIVSDTMAGRKALELPLKDDGYQLVFTSRGDEAVRRAKEYEPDIILLDVMTPEISSYEVCYRMRSDPILLDVPILLVTSPANQKERINGINAGADDFINKPFDKLELLARVRTVTRLNRFRKLREEHEQLEAALFALQQAYDSTIEGWVQAFDLRDKETEGHTRRVTNMTVHIAQVMGLDEETIGHYRRGALLHDVGKLGIPDSILNKTGRLTDDEIFVIQQHPVHAFQWLSRIDYLRPALDIPYCHHEKWNGSGYPRKLKGEQIPLSARIFAVIDVWDALLSDRPYKKSWSMDEAIAYIHSQKNIHFDPEIADIFLENYGNKSSLSDSLENFAPGSTISYNENY